MKRNVHSPEKEAFLSNKVIQQSEVKTEVSRLKTIITGYEPFFTSAEVDPEKVNYNKSTSFF